MSVRTSRKGGVIQKTIGALFAGALLVGVVVPANAAGGRGRSPGPLPLRETEEK